MRLFEIQAVYWQNITVIYTKLYQINRASILKHNSLTSQNSKGYIANGFVHGKYIIFIIHMVFMLRSDTLFRRSRTYTHVK